jgi:hypothetical protein
MPDMLKRTAPTALVETSSAGEAALDAAAAARIWPGSAAMKQRSRCAPRRSAIRR